MVDMCDRIRSKVAAMFLLASALMSVASDVSYVVKNLFVIIIILSVFSFVTSSNCLF